MIKQFKFWIYTQKKWKAGFWREIYLYINIHKSINQNSWNVETTQVSTEKQHVVYTYSGITSLIRKEILTYATTWVNLKDSSAECS